MHSTCFPPVIYKHAYKVRKKMSSTAARRPKRNPTPSSSPKILHLPRHYERRRKRVEGRKKETLCSALHMHGKKKMYECNGNGVSEGEIDDLEDKLEKLLRENVISSDPETKKCNKFNNKAFILQQRIEKVSRKSKEKHLREIKDRARTSCPLKLMHKIGDQSSVSAQNNCNMFFDVKVPRRKMEGMSKEMSERMEKEYEANTHTPDPFALTSKRFEYPDDSSQSARPPHQVQKQGSKKCLGDCKVIVRRIMEQVREENKQWSEMQEMLGQVQEEMDQLKISRDFWQCRALDSERQIEFLHYNAQEWKRKALAIKSMANELRREVSALKLEMNFLAVSQNWEKPRIDDNPEIISLGAHIAKGKHELVFHLKEQENYHSGNNHGRRKSQIFDRSSVGFKRLPFQNIGNSISPSARNNCKTISPY